MLGTTLKKVRDQVHAALTGITSVQGRIIDGEAIPGYVLPNIAITLQTEELDEDSAYMVYIDDPYMRKVNIAIEARVHLSTGSENPLDDLCWSIETELKSYFGSITGSYLHDLALVATTYQLEEDAILIGLATLEYAGFYFDYHAAPSGKPDDPILPQG